MKRNFFLALNSIQIQSCLFRAFHIVLLVCDNIILVCRESSITAVQEHGVPVLLTNRWG